MGRRVLKWVVAAAAVASLAAAAHAAPQRATPAPSPTAATPTPTPQASPGAKAAEEDKKPDNTTTIIIAAIGALGSVLVAYFSGRAGGQQKASAVAEKTAAAAVEDLVKDIEKFKAGMMLVVGDEERGQSFRNNLFNRLAMDGESRQKLANALTLIISDQGTVGQSFRGELFDRLIANERSRHRLARTMKGIINGEEGEAFLADLVERLLTDDKRGKRLTEGLLLLISSNYRERLRGLLSDESVAAQIGGKLPDLTPGAAPLTQHDLGQLREQLQVLSKTFSHLTPPGERPAPAAQREEGRGEEPGRNIA